MWHSLNARVALIEDQWRRLPDGEIEATFQTQEELAWCLAAVELDTSEIRQALG